MSDQNTDKVIKTSTGVFLDKQRQIRPQPGDPLVCGANRMAEGYHFTVEAEEDSRVSLLLYKKGAKEPQAEIILTDEYRTGRVYSVLLPGFSGKNYEYNFKIDDRVLPDPYACRIDGREVFGAPYDGDDHTVRCGFLSEELYDWEGDLPSRTDFADMVLYKVHVRGYTRQAKLPLKKKGTFAGLTEMIPYWQDLGINAIELMPAYEFMEVPADRKPTGLIMEKKRPGLVNYWGYLPGFYFAPKRSYCATKEPEREVRDFIKALHKAGISCIMEMFFPKEVNPNLALRALQFWRRHYHVDGFHVLGDGAPVDLILKDGILWGTKIMAQGADLSIYENEKKPKNRSFAEYNTGFSEVMRRLLKSDEGMIQAAQYHIRHNSDLCAEVNYMTSQDGFTMYDLVSYNYRHNEENGEGNRDGSSYNYSWNCGEEGPSRKRRIRELRERQMRNAFAMMLLSQGIPLLYGGDEIANSQGGNNNAYCQDNAVGWIDWKGLKKQERLHDFVKRTIAFRKEHPILHMKTGLRESDYLAKGFPDVSFHGERAWFCNFEHTSRLLGVMLCGAYATKPDGTEDDFLYIGYNFHWEPRNLALPSLPKGLVWKKVMDTSDLSGNGFYDQPGKKYQKSVETAPRSIVVLMGMQEEEKDDASAAAF